MGIDMTHLGGIVALIGVIAAAAGTVIGSKVSISLLRNAHDRFEDSVWKAIDHERAKAQGVAERLAAVEAVCRERARDGGCQ